MQLHPNHWPCGYRMISAHQPKKCIALLWQHTPKVDNLELQRLKEGVLKNWKLDPPEYQWSSNK